MLHITNGDITADLLRHAGFAEPVLPWRDVLHEGPVPANLDDAALDDERTRFLSGRGWASPEEIGAFFATRRSLLDGPDGRGDVVLWFEHDLYDQLQILQVLDRLARAAAPPSSLSMICIDSFPGVERFTGLGQLDPAELAGLFAEREPVTTAQTDLAVRAWSAFREPEPTALEHLLASDTTPLPFLDAALRRHLAQFPGVHDGLGRTERVALESVAGGSLTAGSLFRIQHEREDRPFLGDATFWTYLHRLAVGPEPLLLLALPDGEPFRHAVCTLTGMGRRVLRGDADRVAVSGIDVWLGGVHLDGHQVPWRWDEPAGCLRVRDTGC